jgi:malate permease and related proteins
MALRGLLDATPILLLIAIGVAVRAAGLVDGKSGLVLTRLAYHVTIPAAIFVGIARSHLTANMLLLPAVGFGLAALLSALTYLSTRSLADRPQTRGVMVVGTVVLGVFGYPFFQLFWGNEGLARMVMFDVGNAIYAGTAALWLDEFFGAQVAAQTASADAQAARPVVHGVSWRRVLTSPVLLASVLGVAASAAQLSVNGPIGNLLDRLAAANTPLAMIAVGVFVRPRAVYRGLMTQFVLMRVLAGGLLGWLLALALGLRGLDMVTAGVASVLPVGTTLLIYAGNEGLDAELAASLISITVIIGAGLINVLPYLYAHWYL